MTLARLTLAATLALAPAASEADVFRSGHAWAAIAYAPEAGEWGWARNFATRPGAEQAALANCRGAAPGGCAVVAVAHAACTALAVGRRGWAAGTGANPAAARAQALGSCRRASGGCRVELDICASPPGAPVAAFR